MKNIVCFVGILFLTSLFAFAGDGSGIKMYQKIDGVWVEMVPGQNQTQSPANQVQTGGRELSVKVRVFQTESQAQSQPLVQQQVQPQPQPQPQVQPQPQLQPQVKVRVQTTAPSVVLPPQQVVIIKPSWWRRLFCIPGSVAAPRSYGYYYQPEHSSYWEESNADTERWHIENTRRLYSGEYLHGYSGSAYGPSSSYSWSYGSSYGAPSYYSGGSRSSSPYSNPDPNIGYGNNNHGHSRRHR